MRGEREKFGRNISCRGGARSERNWFFNFYKVYSILSFLKGYCTLCKKFEDEEEIWMTAGVGFLVLFSTNRDEEQFWITAGDGLIEQ
jgi:hypothetical protein